MIKSHSRTAAATEWNEVRVQNYQAILEAIEADLAGIQLDVEIIESTSFDQVIPELEQRRAQLMEVLRQEKDRDLELDACDKDVLDELREAIVEQAFVPSSASASASFLSFYLRSRYALRAGKLIKSFDTLEESSIIFEQFSLNLLGLWKD
jgi:hypothetical protein